MSTIRSLNRNASAGRFFTLALHACLAVSSEGMELVFRGHFTVSKVDSHLGEALISSCSVAADWLVKYLNSEV